LTSEELSSLLAGFPGLDLGLPSLRLLHRDPPVFSLRGAVLPNECFELIKGCGVVTARKDETMKARSKRVHRERAEKKLRRAAQAGGGEVSKDFPVIEDVGPCQIALLGNILERVSEESGLDLEGGYANIKHYLPGERIRPHVDSNRATLLVYLNDVRRGGHTVFPTLGFKVRPLKGLMLVFPNQPPLMHAGEPVDVGDKWILFYNWPSP